MQRFVLVLALVSVLCLSVTAQPKKSINLQAKFHGLVHIEGDLTTDPAVDIVAIGPGEAANLGSLTTTELRWTVRRDVVLGLLAGTLREAPLNRGTFSAETSDGDRFRGTFTGVVLREGRFRFGIDGDFTILEGTGDLAGVTGDGSFRGTLDLRTQEYEGTLHGQMTLP